MTENLRKIKPTEPCIPHKQALYWLQAVEHQACRVLTVNAAPFSEHAPLRMETHFLLIAVVKSRRWLNHILNSEKGSTEFTSRAKKFMSVTEKAKSLRDIWEHDDEYDTGGGRDRSKMSHVYKSGSEYFDVDYTIFITTRGHGLPVGDFNEWDGLQVILGGCLDIVAVRTAALNLANRELWSVLNLAE